MRFIRKGIIRKCEQQQTTSRIFCLMYAVVQHSGESLLEDQRIPDVEAPCSTRPLHLQVGTLVAEVGTSHSFRLQCLYLPEAKLESPCPAEIASPLPSSAASALKWGKRINIIQHHHLYMFVFTVCVCVCVRQPLVILRTRMIRMMVGLMGREAFRSISSRVIPMMDISTMARSNWFHLQNKRIHSAQLPAGDSVSLLARRPDQPFLEEASQAKGDEFEDGLDDKNDGEDVIAVLEHLLEVLRDAKGERETRGVFKQQPVHCTTLSLHYRWFWGKWQEVLPWLPEAGCSAPCSW